MAMIPSLSHEITDLLTLTCPTLPRRVRTRLVWGLLGVLLAGTIVLRQIASTYQAVTPDSPHAESHDRRLRRLLHDPTLTWDRAYAPVIRQVLRWRHAQRLRILIDESGHTDVVRTLVAAAWYRGRAVPLVWVNWPAQQRLTDMRYRDLCDLLLTRLEALLDTQRAVVVIADRAFGHPAFTDLVTQRGWDWLVRVQRQTCFRDRQGCIVPMHQPVARPGQRWRGQGDLFKKAGWRAATAVAYWSRRHKEPLLLASSLPVTWDLIAEYRKRGAIETLFRDWKAAGWQWESSQVTDLAHLERQVLLLALATLVVLCHGNAVAEEILAQPGPARRTRTWEGKHSLFRLGRDRVRARLAGTCPTSGAWQLASWDAPEWQVDCRRHHALVGTTPRPRARAA